MFFFVLVSLSHSWSVPVPTIKITDSFLCRWENLQNGQHISYLLSPLSVKNKRSLKMKTSHFTLVKSTCGYKLNTDIVSFNESCTLCTLQNTLFCVLSPKSQCRPVDISVLFFPSMLDSSPRVSRMTRSSTWLGWIRRWRPTSSVSSSHCENSLALSATPTGWRFRRTSLGSVRTRLVSWRSAVASKASCRKTTLSASLRRVKKQFW